MNDQPGMRAPHETHGYDGFAVSILNSKIVSGCSHSGKLLVSVRRNLSTFSRSLFSSTPAMVVNIE